MGVNKEKIRFAGRMALVFGVFTGCMDSVRVSAPEAEGEALAKALSVVPSAFTDALVAGGLSQPTLMAIAADGRVFISEKGGRLRVVKNGALLAEPFVTLPVRTDGDRGLLGVALDPDFATNRHLYLFHSTLAGHNRVSRFTASASLPDQAAPGSEAVILDLPVNQGTIHNAGSLGFGADGMLYLSTGDDENRDNSQSLENPFGKVLRIGKDGSIPADNPFYGATTGVNRAIYALGFRNPFSFAVQRQSGRILVNDPGRDNWAGEGSGMEEIDRLLPGANYGWPVSEGWRDTAGFTPPVHAHNTYEHGCAITGGDFYNPVTPKFPMAWYGRYFFADYCGGTLRALDPATGAVTAFATAANRPTGVRTGPDGNLYYLEYNTGSLRRVSAKFPPTVLEAEAASLGGAVTASGQAGHTGSGYVEVQDPAAGWVEFSGTLASASTVNLTLRYANGGASSIPVAVSLNGAVVATGLLLPSTGSWAAWGNVSGTLSLPAGLNRLRITMQGGSPLVDHLRAE